jgi:hypothetical protein
VTAGTLLAPIIEQFSSDILPDGVRTIEAHGISCLDLDNPVATMARDAQNMPWDLGKTAVLNGNPTRLGTRILQKGVPRRLRHWLRGVQSQKHLAAPGRPVFPSVLVSPCASSRVYRSSPNKNIRRTIVESDLMIFAALGSPKVVSKELRIEK